MAFWCSAPTPRSVSRCTQPGSLALLVHLTTALHPACHPDLWWPAAYGQLLQWQLCKTFLSQLPATQVVAFANALQRSDGAPLVRAAHVATNSPPPREVPDLVTATPAGLITATQNYGPFFGWEWTRAGIMARCGAPQLAKSLSQGTIQCLPMWR